MNYFTLLSKLSTLNKYYTWYVCICQQAQARNWQKNNGIYLESHHILPKSFRAGGEKDKDNLVLLTAREHYLVHKLLTKFINHVQFKKKMIYAFWYLSNRKIAHVPTSRSYEIAKQQLINNIKARHDSTLTRSKKARPGKLNGMYGKTHTYEVKAKLAQLRRDELTGKSYEDLYGEEKANRLKQDKSDKLKLYCQLNPGVRKGANNANSKSCSIISPSGLTFTTKSLKTFCNDYQLPYAKMSAAARGNRLDCNGWVVNYMQEV